ncbi:MAG: hypothetical protein ACE5IL_15330, partial [Myxococcota bacterium]
MDETLQKPPLRPLPLHPDLLQDLMKLEEEVMLPEARCLLKHARKAWGISPPVQVSEKHPIG